jgi:ATP-dependent Lhr-like helicase
MTNDARNAAIQTAYDWFAGRNWKAFPYQQAVWDTYLDGESGLIYTATGTGKTYAAWFGPLLEWLIEHPDADKRADAKPPPLRVLWITPLRALAADTEGALRTPLAELGINWTLETRTGDTSSVVRSRQRKRLPSALVTTPESLSLLLAREDAATLFAHLEAVIVDEWHELMATKRGVQTELGLARLRRWRPALRTWGLSATMGNLETARDTLLGVGATGKLVHGQVQKPVTIESVIPATMERFPWAGHLGLKLLPQVIKVIESGQTSLVFTNTRSQTEVWYQAIIDARPDWIGEVALHHGSLDRKTRDWVEDGLRLGRLRCVVCTSSLDLGVDFAPVDNVLQIGSPKGAARLLQRTGRSGHRPGAESKVTCVPTHAFELVEVAAARDAVRAGHLEDRPPFEKPLDVLIQHMVTIALGGGFTAEALLREVRTSHAYRNLTDEEFGWCIDFLTHGGEALKAYPAYARIVERDGRYTVEQRVVAQTHRMSIGTIVSDTSLSVQYIRGAQIGSVEESFASRLKPGDRFTLGGKIVEFVRLRDMKVWVRKASSVRGIIPRWAGGLMPLSTELTRAVRTKLDEARRGEYTSPEMQAVRSILELQQRVSAIPAPDDFLVERTKTREGHHLYFYPLEGRLVHEGLAALFAYRLGQMQPITFTIAVNDYGFELLSPDPVPLDAALMTRLLDSESLAMDILNSLAAGEMARRQFREIARIAGLIVSRFPGGQKTTRQLQTSSGLLYDVFAKYDPDNLLMHQARREVLERQLESTRLKRAVDRLNEANLLLLDVKRPTPFGFPLLVEHFRETMTSETLADRVKKMQLALEKDFTPGKRVLG